MLMQPIPLGIGISFLPPGPLCLASGGGMAHSRQRLDPVLRVMLSTTKRMLITAGRSRILARPSARACVQTCACARAQLTLHACVFVCAQVTRGLESTTFALLAGFTNFGGTLSGQIGLFLTQVTLIFIQCKLC